MWNWPRLRRGASEEAALRCVMVDVETSGLDAARDRLLAIAAVGMRVDWARGRIVMLPGDSFEVVLQQQEASPRGDIPRDNILLHGIGIQRQREGVPAAQALAAFRDCVGAAPLLAFHAAFDETMIGRYTQQALGGKLANGWLDIEHLCAATHPQVRARSLDDWMAHFGITCAVRHQAAADTWAECELLLRIWPKVAAECRSWRDVQRMARAHRWLPRA